MSTWFVVTCVFVVVLMVTCTVATRVNSRVEQYPACYTHASTWQYNNNSREDCKHPLYTNCRYSDSRHLCCGPDHYCCENNRACCMRFTWSTYEVVGVATGVLSWTAILVVLVICVGTQWVKKVRHYLNRKKKVFPQHDHQPDTKVSHIRKGH